MLAVRDQSSTQYPSSKDHSINSAAIPNRFEIEQSTKSLAQCCPKISLTFIPILAILGTVAFMIDQGFNCSTTITDVNITIKEIPAEHTYNNLFNSLIPYEIKKVINGPTVPVSIQWYWDANAHYNAVVNCFCSIVWPFLSAIILIHLFLVRFRIRNQKYRTIILCILMQTGKFGFTQAFCQMFDAIVNFVNINTEIFQFEIISAPANQYANYCLATTMYGIFAWLFLIIDQYFMYDDKILNLNNNNQKKELNDNVVGSIEIKYSYFKPVHCVYPKNKWFSLLFINKPKSKCGIVMDAIFKTVLCVSVWLIIQALYTAQVGFTIGGLFGQGNVIIKSSENIGATAADYLVLTNILQKIFVQQFTIIGVIMPILVQSLIVLVWFVPLKVFYFRWMIRFIFVLQSLNAIEVYAVAAAMCFEYKDYTSWYSAYKGGSPALCGVGTPVYENLGGCIYADPFFNYWGIVLLVGAIVVQWFTFIYTLYTANKIGVNVLRFR
eukprot:421088_1